MEMDRKKAKKQFRKIEKLKGGMRLAAEGWKSRFQILIATILSARSLDETTIKVCKVLFKNYGTARKLSVAKLGDIQKIIRPINFYRNKSKNIINCSIELMEGYNGRVPEDFDKLVELSGVGSKTANVFLSEIGGDEVAVDTHVYYISRYLGWSDSKNPDNVGRDLRDLFPKKMWSDLNPILVKFGKKYTSRKEKNKLLDEISEI